MMMKSACNDKKMNTVKRKVSSGSLRLCPLGLLWTAYLSSQYKTAMAMALSTTHTFHKTLPTNAVKSDASAKSLLDTARLIRQYKLSGEENTEVIQENSPRLKIPVMQQKYYRRPNDDKELSWTECLFDEECCIENLDCFVDDTNQEFSGKVIPRDDDADADVTEAEISLQNAAVTKRTKVNSPVLSKMKSSVKTKAPNGEISNKNTNKKEAKSKAKKAKSKKSKGKKSSKVSVQSISKNSSQKSTIKSSSKSTSPTKQQQSVKKRSKSSPSSQRLTHEEEVELANIIKQGSRLERIKSEFESVHGRDITRAEWTELAELDSPASLRRLVSSYRRAKSKLVMANMGLVYHVVRQGGYLSKRGKDGVTEEELVQEGSLGLIRAAELFDPDKGHRFSTYATIWIKGTLGNTKVGQAIVVPDREKNKWKKVQKAITDLTALKGNTGEKPTTAEIAKMVDMPIDQVEALQRQMPRAKNLLSLDFQYDRTSRSGAVESSDISLYGDKALSSNDNFYEILQLRSDVVVALSKTLNEREAMIMRLRYGLKDGKFRSIVECAEVMGISRARVQQLAASSLKKLRSAEDAKSLEQYLLSV